MNHYERHFDTDWDEINLDDAALHAYAIGVAEVLGATNDGHLARLTNAMETRYDRSVVELAYEEGRSEATSVSDDGDVWAELFQTRGGEDPQPVERLPDVVRRADMLEGFDLERPDTMDLPDFLRRR